MRQGMIRAGGLAAVAVVGVLALTACGGGTDSAATSSRGESVTAQSAAAPQSAPAAQSAAAAESPVVETAADGSVPDPCGLLSQDDLATILGKAPGNGELAGTSPNLRQVCTYPGGTILGVEVGEDYDASLAAIETAGLGGSASELKGVGERAVFVTYDMGVVQVFALQGGYMVDVTGMLSKKQAIALAEAMLSAL